MTAAKRGTAEDFFFRIFRNRFAVSDNILLHRPATLRRRDMTVSRDLFTCCYGQHFWVKLEKVGKRVEVYIIR